MSDVFAQLAHQITPGRVVPHYEGRNSAYRQLLAAPLVAVSAADTVDCPRLAGDATFDGGVVGGELYVVDVEAGQVLCHAPTVSAPDTSWPTSSLRASGRRGTLASEGVAPARESAA
jgi:hypothetical protein